MKNLTRLPEGGFQWKANMPSIIASYDRLMEDIQYLHPYLGETLFVRGERSRYILDEDFTALLPVFPKAKLSTIPEAGHWVHADQPTAFFEVIHNFLRH
jgi:pimeloyl-ACP methyl ester carboxylesterase